MQNNKEEWEIVAEIHYSNSPFVATENAVLNFKAGYLSACKKRDEDIGELQDTNLELEQANYTQYRIIGKLKEENEKLKELLRLGKVSLESICNWKECDFDDVFEWYEEINKVLNN